MYTMVLVDDEKGIIEGLKVIIRRYLPNCEVIGSAHDGIQGFQLVQELRPDIVISDIRMLRSDGLEMIEKLNNEGIRSRFILLSGYSEFEYAKRGMHLGARFYLNKPIEEKELQACVKQLIGEIEAERGVPSAHQRESAEPQRKKDVISEVKQYVMEHYDENISLADLSSRFFLNLHYLSQLFKEKTGQTYLDYLTQVRIGRAKELLENSDLKVYEISHLVGYSDTTHFSKMFERLAGCKPTEYRKLTQQKS